MNKDVKKLEDAIRKLRVDFPETLLDVFEPGRTLQAILSSEAKHQEFESGHLMLTAGMHGVIRENSETLKDSAIEYHRLHTALKASHATLEEAKEKAGRLKQLFAAPSIAHYLESLTHERQQAEGEEKEKRLKQVLAVEMLSLKDIFAGRLQEVSKSLRYVETESVRSEIKKRTEERVWHIKKEIEVRVRRHVLQNEELSDMEVHVLPLINGSLLTTLHEAVQEGLVETINKASVAIRRHTVRKKSDARQEEKEALSKTLPAFADEIQVLLSRTVSLVKQAREVPPPAKEHRLRYSSSILREITVSEIEHKTHSRISLPPLPPATTEKDVLDLFVTWISKFFRRLSGDSTHAGKEKEQLYDITTIKRTPEAMKLYHDTFVTKYGMDMKEEVERDEVPQTTILNIHEINTDECLLAVHGISRILARSLSLVHHDLFPGVEDTTKELQDLGISKCFEKKRETLLAMINKAAKLPKPRPNSLGKYTHIAEEVLAAAEEFIELMTEGLEEEFITCTQEVLDKLVCSIEKTFRETLRVSEKEYDQIKYYTAQTEEELRTQILQWNSPQAADPLEGSFFTALPNQDFIAVSAFLSLVEDALDLTVKVAEIVEQFQPQTQPQTQGSNPENPKTPESVQALTALKETIWGYFTVHFLILTKQAMDKLVDTGEIQDKRFMHFLSMSTLLVTHIAPHIQQYIAMFLFMNIDRCLSVYNKSTFKHLLASIQTKLGRALGESTEKDTIYIPEFAIFAIKALQTQDKVYMHALLQMFKDDEIVTGIIKAQIATRPKNVPQNIPTPEHTNKPKDTPKDATKPKDTTKDANKPKDTTKDATKDTTKLKDTPKDTTKPKDTNKPKDTTKDANKPKDATKPEQ
ncbi:hypothetical protein NEDG_00234 [Nematocida displodere]|uniref:Uncharacterized protein n=1 Tax=Nematocida displodere TaxID=1805483 RepID=A0A177ELA3_9MICR|nr:hypothetical protein NEDG_00234 [Nematocida displodere]